MVMLGGVPGGVQAEEVPEADADHALLVLLHGLHELQEARLVCDGRAVVLLAQILAVHEAAAVFIEGGQVDAVDALLVGTVLLADVGGHGLYEILGESVLQARERVIAKVGRQIREVAVLDKGAQPMPAAAEHQVEILLSDHGRGQFVLVIAACHPCEFGMDFAHDGVVRCHLLVFRQDFVQVAEFVHDADLDGGVLNLGCFRLAALLGSLLAGILSILRRGFPGVFRRGFLLLGLLGVCLAVIARVILAAGRHGQGHGSRQRQRHGLLQKLIFHFFPPYLKFRIHAPCTQAWQRISGRLMMRP